MVYYLPFFILILFLKNYINLLQYYAEFLKLGNFLNWTACLRWLLILTCTLECCTTMVMAFLGSCISFNSLNGLFVLRLFEAYWVSKHCTRSPQLSRWAVLQPLCILMRCSYSQVFPFFAYKCCVTFVADCTLDDQCHLRWKQRRWSPFSNEMPKQSFDSSALGAVFNCMDLELWFKTL